MKVLTIIGARPQFVKAAVVSRAFAEYRHDVQEVLVHTGQHYDANMSDVFFEDLGIPKPDYNLGIGGGSHGQNTGRMVEKLEQVMLRVNPHWVLVYGDTDSTLAGALAAAKLNIPVAHIEAGLRSFNRNMPEEINRVLTDHIAELLFTPTETARKNLIREGVLPKKVKLLGDVMYDALLYYKDRARKPALPPKLTVNAGDFVLCTIHRAENTDNPERLIEIFEGLRRCARTVILPLHPRTKRGLEKHKIAIPENVWIFDPVGYLEMVWLESNSFCIATDSGGVQKEAYFFEKPCITLRDETEWVELVEAGVNILVGADKEKIIKAFAELEECCFNFDGTRNIYGNGTAAQNIVSQLGHI